MTELELADTDPQSFLGALIASANNALPSAVMAGVFTVDRKRSLSDRMAGRPGTITGLQLVTPGKRLTLRYGPGPRWTPEASLVFGGVIISRRTLTLGRWLTTFAGRIAALAADAAGDAAASSQALQKLGIQPAGADIRVDDATIARDLQTLAARLKGRVPEAAAQSISRIGELLSDTIPRVAGSGEPEIVVRRTATIYLPDTLRAFLSLPADWVGAHVFPDGRTPEQAFTAQLFAIEAAARTMRNSAVEQNASALLVNGRFLSDRFATSNLDLP